MGLGKIFDISRRSLATYQSALDITAHNISNASNPNYTRQKAVLTAESPQINSGFAWGSGVKLGDISRVRSQLTDSQLRSNNTKLAYYNTNSAMLNEIETIFSEPSDLGLSNLIDSFFNSWHQLSVTPNSVPLRQNVIQAAIRMSDKVKSVNDDLNFISSDIANNFKIKVTELNNALKEVQKLNAQIFSAKSAGAKANDLMDERDRIIDDISKIVNINVATDSSNTVSISIGGILAVDGTAAAEFKPAEKNGKLFLSTSQGNQTPILTGGDLAALSDLYNTEIPNYQNTLNSIITKIYDSVNEVHQQGYSITNPPENSIDFFESFKNGNLVVNNDIIKNPNLIAVSEDGNIGNGAVAIKIAELNNQKILNGSTIADNYSNLISEIGNDKKTADQISSAQQLVLQQLEQQKASQSGVSVDEEMTNMIQFQRSYDASAKLIKIADEMLKTLIEMV